MKNKKAQKTLLSIGAVVIILALVGVGIFFFLKSISTEPFLDIEGYYDADGNLIEGTSQSVIGGIEGVKYITLKINVKNEDTVALNLNVKSITPTEVSSAKPTEVLIIEAEEIGSWTTGLIDVEPYEGTVQDFCVIVESEKIPALRESSEVSGCIGIKIEPNPVANFDISLDSNIGDNAINPECEEDWSCSEWSDCSNSIQIRTCNDLNECGTEKDKPAKEQACEVAFQTNAVNGDYKDSSIWIDFGSGKYYYGGYSTFSCTSLSAGETILTTTEGYPICTRSGYEITSRVYLDDGDGLIFKP